MEIGAPLLIAGTVSSLILLSLALRYLHCSSSPKKRAVNRNLPPSLPLSSLLVGLARISWPSGPSLADINHLLHRLQTSRGRITALLLPFGTAVFISDAGLAHAVLVSNGAVVSDRLPPSTPLRSHGLDRARVSTTSYGDAWRCLRRNLLSFFNNPSSAKHFAAARRRGKEKLLERLRSEAAASAGIVRFRNNFSYVFYGLIASMCFGGELDDRDIVALSRTIQRMIVEDASSLFFAFLPRIVQKMFSKSRKNIHDAGVLNNLLRSSRELPGGCYADTLREFELPEKEDGVGSRKLREYEILALCEEFIAASGHTTSIALEWIMAELVNHRHVQEKLADELCQVVNDGEEEGTAPYLRAVVMEGLRLHPPTPAFLRYAGKEFEVGGFVVPEGAMVFFNTAAMGVDEKVWEDPVEFKPERFLVAGGEAKVMAFGGGRRACAGFGLAMSILSYFVAHLVREFEWRPVEGERVDMSEKMEFFMPMKSPLRARTTRRSHKIN